MLEIRAHHILCIPRFYGISYNKDFAKHWKNVCHDIKNNPEMKIKVVRKCDDMCSKCPHKKGDICKKEPEINSSILSMDETVLKKLGLKENSVHEARDVFNLSMESIQNADIRNTCKGCDFLEGCIKWGVNNSFEKDMNR